MSLRPIGLTQAAQNFVQSYMMGQNLKEQREQNKKDELLRSLMGQALTGGADEQVMMQLAQESPQDFLSVQNFLEQKNKQEQQALAQAEIQKDKEEVKRMLVMDDASIKNYIAQLGQNPEEAREAQFMLSLDEDQRRRFIEITAEQLGVKTPEPRNQINWGPIDVSKFTPESLALAQFTNNYGDLSLREGSSPPPEYVKELRSELRRDVGKLEQDGRSLNANYEKLKGLANEIQKGNRTAVSQGIISLVKIGEPSSVVSEKEMSAALANPNPTASVFNVLRNSGTSEDVIQSVIAQIDPLNPGNVNKNSLLATAQAMLKPNAVQLSNQYNRAKTRAENQLTQGGALSIFDSERDVFFDDLSNLEFDISREEDQQSRDRTIKKSKMTQSEAASIVDSLLKGIE